MQTVDSVLNNLAILIPKLEAQKNDWHKQPSITCREVCHELSIFDWFPEKLSISRLKDMRKFLLEAKKLGFNGYCCFKVGEEGTASGKWAYSKESVDGYSPKDCACLFESFYAVGKNYWQISKDCKTFYPNGDNFNSITKIKDLEQMWMDVIKRQDA